MMSFFSTIPFLNGLPQHFSCFFMVAIYCAPIGLEAPAYGCGFFRPLKYRLRVDRLTPVNAWQPRRVRFHGVMPRNRFIIAPQE